MSRLAIYIVVICMVTTTGCATLFASKKSVVAMQTNPATAEVWINGNLAGTTPLSVELSKKREHTITFKKAGYQDVTQVVDTKVGGGWIILDILGGLAPVIIDAATGSWKSLDTKVINLNMASIAAAPTDSSAATKKK